ncbi:ankyrin repeat domain-containing protein [Wolbachia endosymbiont (group A) of Conops quadrifasciatus]|uniref:ankyrin repeat domain-containing protein n=1 Tax=Wolbachia endosymbiont (group A) of Conops quadrifasciatus TaxID=3066143 RepID=UPI0031334D37
MTEDIFEPEQGCSGEADPLEAKHQLDQAAEGSPIDVVREVDLDEEEYALHCAAKAGDTDFIDYLIEKGVNVNAADGDGCTPLLVNVNAASKIWKEV